MSSYNAQRYLDLVEKSRTDYATYAKFVHRSKKDKDDPFASEVKDTPAFSIFSDLIQKRVTGEDRRILTTSVRPQVGKTLILARTAVPFFSGLYPDKSILYLTYSQTRAEYIGRQVRPLLRSPRHTKVFPGYELTTDSNSLFSTSEGGTITLAGMDGMITGLTGDVIIIDDPYKNMAQARSPTQLEAIWDEFFASILSRIRDDTIIIICHTRWSENDIIGRCCDPTHPARIRAANTPEDELSDFERGIASIDPEMFEYVNIPSIITDPKFAAKYGIELKVPTDPSVIKAFGSQPMASLKHDQQNLKMLATIKLVRPAFYASLYDGKPTPEAGVLFTNEMFNEVLSPDSYPKNLTIFSASDHAVSTGEQNDKSFIGAIGVDERDNWWVMPEAFWGRFTPDVLCQKIVDFIRYYKPLIHYPEDDMIWKSVTPQVHSLMVDAGINHTTLRPLTSQNKALEARCAVALSKMSQRKIMWPAFAPWYSEAKREILGFPYAAHDDAVSFLSLVTRELPFMHTQPLPNPVRKPPSIHTLDYWEKYDNVVQGNFKIA